MNFYLEVGYSWPSFWVQDLALIETGSPSSQIRWFDKETLILGVKMMANESDGFFSVVAVIRQSTVKACEIFTSH